MAKLSTLIMAAGKGTRMKSDLPKVLHLLKGKPLISYVIAQARKIGSERIIAIIGHKKELVIKALEPEKIEFAIQEQQLGTGHAIQQTEKILDDWSGHVLILSGDVPMLSEKTLSHFLKKHKDDNADATVLTTNLEDPGGYGRIVRSDVDTLEKIVEEKDADENIKKITEINSGIYLFKKEHLFENLHYIGNSNSQGEYYLPDVLPIMVAKKLKVSLFVSDNYYEIQGINTIEQLKEIEKSMEN